MNNDHVISTSTRAMEISSEKGPSKAKLQYDCYPSWHGELCDNVPNYLFCQFEQKKPTKMTTTASKTSGAHAGDYLRQKSGALKKVQLVTWHL